MDFLILPAKTELIGQGPTVAFFIFLAAVAALSAIGVVAFNNAIRSALCLVVNFFTLAILYFTLKAEILGITQIVVYTGAIMVLFLFVVMLLNLGAPQALGESRDPKRAWGFLFSLLLFLLVMVFIFGPLRGIVEPKAIPAYGSPQAMGRTLFTTYVWPFEMASVLLLVGIVGSILLAKRRIA